MRILQSVLSYCKKQDPIRICILQDPGEISTVLNTGKESSFRSGVQLATKAERKGFTDRVEACISLG
jgi:hypothetical protein